MLFRNHETDGLSLRDMKKRGSPVRTGLMFNFSFILVFQFVIFSDGVRFRTILITKTIIYSTDTFKIFAT